MLQNLIKTVHQDNKKYHNRNHTSYEASISQQVDGHPTRKSYRASSSIQKLSNKQQQKIQTYSDARLKHDLTNYSIRSDSSDNPSDSDHSSSPSIDSATISQFCLPPVPFFTHNHVPNSIFLNLIEK